MTRYERIINARYYRLGNTIIDNNEFRLYFVENFVEDAPVLHESFLWGEIEDYIDFDKIKNDLVQNGDMDYSDNIEDLIQYAKDEDEFSIIYYHGEEYPIKNGDNNE